MTITFEAGSKQRPAHTRPFALLVHALVETGRTGAGAVRDWHAARALGRIDDAGLKDIGVSRGNIGWSVRNGREDGPGSTSGSRRPSPRARHGS